MIEKDPNETFGQYITRIRDGKGYSQRKLALVTKISNTTINRIESGETANPDLNTLKVLAEHLGIDETYMLKAAGYIEGKSDKATPQEQELIQKYENMPDFEDAESAFKFILEQPALAAYGGYDVNKMSEEEIIELANDLLLTLRISIERRKAKK